MRQCEQIEAPYTCVVMCLLCWGLPSSSIFPLHSKKIVHSEHQSCMSKNFTQLPCFLGTKWSVWYHKPILHPVPSLGSTAGPVSPWRLNPSTGLPGSVGTCGPQDGSIPPQVPQLQEHLPSTAGVARRPVRGGEGGDEDVMRTRLIVLM